MENLECLLGVEKSERLALQIAQGNRLRTECPPHPNRRPLLLCSQISLHSGPVTKILPVWIAVQMIQVRVSRIDVTHNNPADGSAFSNCLLRLRACRARNSPPDVPCASDNLYRNARSSSANDTVIVLMAEASY